MAIKYMSREGTSEMKWLILISLVFVGCDVPTTSTTEREAYDKGYDSGKEKAEENEVYRDAYEEGFDDGYDDGLIERY